MFVIPLVIQLKKKKKTYWVCGEGRGFNTCVFVYKQIKPRGMMYVHSVPLFFKCTGKNLCIIYLLLQGQLY